MEDNNLYYHLKGPALWEHGGLPGTYEEQLRELYWHRARNIDSANHALGRDRPAMVSLHCRVLGLLQERIEVLELAVMVRAVEEEA